MKKTDGSVVHFGDVDAAPVDPRRAGRRRRRVLVGRRELEEAARCATVTRSSSKLLRLRARWRQRRSPGRKVCRSRRRRRRRDHRGRWQRGLGREREPQRDDSCHTQVNEQDPQTLQLGLDSLPQRPDEPMTGAFPAR